MARAVRPAADGEPTLAVGAVVRAHVVARLFGVRLLRLDATVVITPPVVAPVDDLPGPVVVGSAVVPRGALPQIEQRSDGGLLEAERLLRLARSETSSRRRR
ncbi:hypothetical protein [Mumia sp. Pv 4-285]|uniref:hypothetical protein n=1 Tax=Mumia qirimensis TaxID=3234852 RepID=UPI00351D5976